jgi:hypothetical protein
MGLRGTNVPGDVVIFRALPSGYLCFTRKISGRIEDDYNVLVKLSCEGNGGEIELAKWTADRLLCLEPSEPVNYLLMSNTFAAAGAWHELANVRSVMRNNCGKRCLAIAG